MPTVTNWAESLTPLIQKAREQARNTHRVWYVPFGAKTPDEVTMKPDLRQSRYAVRPNGTVEWQVYDKKINGVNPGWGKPYGGDGPHYVTDKGVLVTMFRNGQKVRFYDQNGEQVGPEQMNVAPATAYALHYHWRYFNDIVKRMIEENPNQMIQASLIARVASRSLKANVLSASADIQARVQFTAKTDEVVAPDTIVTTGSFSVDFGGIGLSRNIEVILQGSGSNWGLSQFMVIGQRERDLEVMLHAAFKPLIPAIVNRLRREKRL